MLTILIHPLHVRVELVLSIMIWQQMPIECCCSCCVDISIIFYVSVKTHSFDLYKKKDKI